MKFLSIDIETTGTDSKKDQILEVGMVYVDTLQHPSTWKEFRKVITHKRYEGDAFAIAMNGRLFQEIADNTSEDIINSNDLTSEIYNFLNFTCDIRKWKDKINIAAKNPNFDLSFLNKVNAFEHYNIHRRLIDPAILYVDFINDTELPNLSLCKERAGLNSIVTHNALDDAWDIVLLIVNKMGFDVCKFITDEFLDKHYQFTKIKQTNKFWQLDSNTIIQHTGSKHIFNKYVLKTFDSKMEFILTPVWSINEIDKYISF